MTDWHDTKASSRLGIYRADWTGAKWIAKRMQRQSFPQNLGKFETLEEAKACCEEHMRGCLHLPDTFTSQAK